MKTITLLFLTFCTFLKLHAGDPPPTFAVTFYFNKFSNDTIDISSFVLQRKPFKNGEYTSNAKNTDSVILNQSFSMKEKGKAMNQLTQALTKQQKNTKFPMSVSHFCNFLFMKAPDAIKKNAAKNPDYITIWCMQKTDNGGGYKTMIILGYNDAERIMTGWLY